MQNGGTSGTPLAPITGAGATTDDLLAFTRDLLAEHYADFYDDEAILRDLNAGIVRIFSSVKALPAKATIAIQPGVTTYPAPADLASYGKVTIAGQREPLTPVLIHEVDEGKPGKTRHYDPGAVMGDGSPAITLYPAPASSGSLVIHYWRFPAMLCVHEHMETGPTWHQRYHFLPCYYAAGVQLHKDKRPENAELMMAKFERGVVEYKRWLNANRPSSDRVRKQVQMREM